MAKLFKGLICLTDIEKNKIVTFRNGKKYINVVAWLNDEPDQFGNLVSIQQQTKKDEDKIYIGNLKLNDPDEQVPEIDTNKSKDNPEEDDLPF